MMLSVVKKYSLLVIRPDNGEIGAKTNGGESCRSKTDASVEVAKKIFYLLIVVGTPALICLRCIPNNGGD